MEFFRDLAIKYPRLYTFWIGPARPVLVTCHPETSKVVLKSTLPKTVVGVGSYNLIRPWLGKSIFDQNCSYSYILYLRLIGLMLLSGYTKLQRFTFLYFQVMVYF